MTRELHVVRIDKVRPNLRLVFSEEEVLLLAGDIRAHGLREPLLVELVEHWFEIVDGEKRWRACKRLGWTTVTVLVTTVSPV